MMEAELNALASSNQQLRSQLEISAQQVSTAARERLVAQDAAAQVRGCVTWVAARTHMRVCFIPTF